MTEIISIGRLGIKTAGRDSNQKCVIVDIIDKNYVLIDGNVRRKKCNIRHIEPLNIVVKIKKKAATKEVLKAMEKAGIEITKKEKPAKTKEKGKK